MHAIKQSDFNTVMDTYVKENNITITNLTTANFGDGEKMYNHVYHVFVEMCNPEPTELALFIKEIKRLYVEYLNKAKGF